MSPNTKLLPPLSIISNPNQLFVSSCVDNSDPISCSSWVSIVFLLRWHKCWVL
ncbi:hypothetical protein LINPERHAP2_LOCUS14382 [Linum perenne]